MREPRFSTGRTRYRVGWFGRLILQVEIIETRIGRTGAHFHSMSWVDARCEDFCLDAELFSRAPVPFVGQAPAKLRPYRPTVPPTTPPSPPRR